MLQKKTEMIMDKSKAQLTVYDKKFESKEGKPKPALEFFIDEATKTGDKNK